MKRFRQWLHKLFIENAWLKLVAIIFALLLNYNAREETIKELETDVPVTISAYPKDQILLSQPPSVLRIRVRGDVQRLTEALARRIPLEVDLADYRDGETKFFEKDELEKYLGGGVQVLSVSPAKYEVKLDEVVKRRIPVAIEIFKEPGPYYSLDRERRVIEPRYVEISGAKTTLDTIRQWHTEPLDLSGVTADFSGKVALESRPGVTVSRSSVQVKLPISERGAEKELPGCKIQVRNCPATHICEASPAFYRARVQGKKRMVDMITVENISNYVYVDASRLPIKTETLQRQFPAVEPTLGKLKDAVISLPKVRYFNITVTRR